MRCAMLLPAFLLLGSCCEAAPILQRSTTLKPELAATLDTHLKTLESWAIELHEPGEARPLVAGDYLALDDPPGEIDRYLHVSPWSGRLEMTAWMGYPEDWDSTLSAQRERMRTCYDALRTEVGALPEFASLHEHVTRGSTVWERRFYLALFVLGLPGAIVILSDPARQRRTEEPPKS